MKAHNVEHQAWKDISEYTSQMREKQYESAEKGFKTDNYVVSNTYLFTKESRMLNNELGLHSINKKQEYKRKNTTK